jgi:Xaa-Pro aminopeptidase
MRGAEQARSLNFISSRSPGSGERTLLRDIDRLMQERKIGALLCYGDTSLQNPELTYVTRTNLPRGGIFLKKGGEEPVLVVSNIDLQGAKQGVVRRIRTYDEFDYFKIVKRFGRRKAYAELLNTILSKEGVEGRIVIAGRNRVSPHLAMTDSLRKRGRKVVGEVTPTIIDVARATKDPTELEAMELAAKKTLKVVAKTEKFLAGLKMQDGSAEQDGERVTAGQVKRLVRRWTAEEGLTLAEDLILAAGAVSADPHGAGGDRHQLKAAEPIVFDIFPVDSSGYWFDFTRTYALGRPGRELISMYETVKQAHEIGMDNCRAGMRAEEPMLKVCSFFSSRGWPTPLDAERGGSKAKFLGFIHGLGHGVGLTIGEEPYLGLHQNDRLENQMVTSMEPGLYVPGMGGVRLEDTVIVTKSRPRIMGQHPYELSL